MNEQIPDTWRSPRPIVKRILIEGTLELKTPAHFGAGDPDALTHVDMVLLRDPLEGKALLPGASITGALRNYLREREMGYDAKKTGAERGTMAVALFGGSKGDDQGAQSLLIVDDALAEIEQVLLRDGVSIDPVTRTAAKDQLFSMELLPAGTTFELRFELLVPQKGEAVKKSEAELLQALAAALQGLQAGEVRLGARKRRGFGECIARNWKVTEYDLTTSKGLIAWLNEDQAEQQTDKDIAALLNVEPAKVDYRSHFDLKATFALDGSLLIRSGFGSREGSPDIAHLHTIDAKGNRTPLVPGTSFAGVIRHRALRIAKTIFSLEASKAEELVDEMFGCEKQVKNEAVLKASRVIVEDSRITGVESMVQTRVKIDRFTGGAFETALINEEPVFDQNHKSRITLNLTLRNPAEAEIGLLLLVLKDLWLSDLPLGGESSIGRGRLQGINATLTQIEKGQQTQSWQIKQEGNNLSVENPSLLQKKVDALHSYEIEAVQ